MTKPKEYLSKRHQEKRGLLAKENETKAALENVLVKAFRNIQNPTKKKTEGIEEGFFANVTIDGQKHDVLEKSLTIKELYRELIGGHCYRYFSRGKVNVADVMLIDDSNDHLIRLGSKIIQDFIPFGSYAGNVPNYLLPKNSKYETMHEERHPRINNLQELVVYDKGLKKDVEVKGYITMLMIAKFIGDGDCIGPGANAGYILKKNSHGDYQASCVKIDPGHSFTEEKELHINHKFTGNHQYYRYSTFPPLLPNKPHFYDNKKINSLYKKQTSINSKIDSRDLLAEELTYDQIINSSNKKLYDEMALAAYDIATTTKEDLHFLVFGDKENRVIPEIKLSQLDKKKQPKYLNPNIIIKEEERIFDMLLENQKCFKEIYSKEIEHGKHLKHIKLQDSLKKYHVNIDQELITRMITGFFISAKQTPIGSKKYNELLTNTTENILRINLKEDYNKSEFSKSIKAKHNYLNNLLDDQFKLATTKDTGRSRTRTYAQIMQDFLDNCLAIIGINNLRSEGKIQHHQEVARETSDHVTRVILAHHKDKQQTKHKTT